MAYSNVTCDFISAPISLKFNEWEHFMYRFQLRRKIEEPQNVAHEYSLCISIYLFIFFTQFFEIHLNKTDCHGYDHTYSDCF